MTLEQVLVACVTIQFLLIAVLYARSFSHSQELHLIYLFMRELNSDLYFKLARKLGFHE